MGDRPFSLVALVVSFPNTIGVKVCGCQEGDEGFDGVPACFALSRAEWEDCCRRNVVTGDARLLIDDQCPDGRALPQG